MKVANAQLSELQKVAGLTGNPAQDMPVVQSLMMDFSGGIKKNMENQQMVCVAISQRARVSLTPNFRPFRALARGTPLDWSTFRKAMVHGGRLTGNGV